MARRPEQNTKQNVPPYRPAVPARFTAAPSLVSLNSFRRRSQSQPLGLVIDNHPRQDHCESKYLEQIADGSILSVIRQEFDERHVSEECIRYVLRATVEGMHLFPKKEQPTTPDLHLIP